jgi:uncharacterized protein DUF4262
MPRTNSSNEYERKLLANIERVGWQCTSVGGSGKVPRFTYTIGLHHSFNFPELIIFGVTPSTSYRILAVAADAARAGTPLDLEKPSDALIAGYDCIFVPVQKAAHAAYVLSALWYYEGEPFPLYQIVWPSKDGVLPWDDGASESFRVAQPVLGARSGDN